MPLAERRQPFDHPNWLFEVKYDGFRALAYMERGAVRLVSRKGNTYKSFPTLCQALGAWIDTRERGATKCDDFRDLSRAPAAPPASGPKPIKTALRCGAPPVRCP
jgi:hypothetical protein